ncbi:CehA/McbA family metallohydrolase [Haloimpatiens massiliensis]|uniref:CehA/McbA family metallohydrolase n=1 Tax=Haloimpatiens massiliensis TaxID=1658110 RepID=UPI000C827AA6|nr:CehA/McbA family metallohydrolase [Haloimpatiens massiliensis]
MFEQKEIVKKVEPLEDEKIENRKPKIQIYLNSNNVKKDFLNIKMYLDGKTIKYKVSDKKIKYTPKNKLKIGSHIIRISAMVSSGESYDYSWNFTIEEKETFNYYFGNLHSHTSYSSGQGTPAEAFDSAKNKGMDFWALTDHSRALNSDEKWKKYMSTSSKFNKKHKRNLAIYGKEISVKGIGHLNLFNCDNMDKLKINRLDKLESVIDKYNDAILCINHPGKSIYNLKDKKHLNKNICIMEVGNGSFGEKYNRYEKYYYGMLDEQWHLGAVNGQDNHKRDWGKWDNLTVILAPKLKDKYIFEAIRNRRIYSTESNTMKLKFKLGNIWMGGIVKEYKKGEIIQFTVECEDKKIPIEKLQIITNGAVILEEKNIEDYKCLWKPKIKLERENAWYVIKVIQKEGRIGISSPIIVK